MPTTIHSPAQGFTGPTAIGPTVLDFTDGVATTDVNLSAPTLEYLRKRGYTVDLDDPAQAEGADDLSSFTVADLREHAEDQGIDLGGATKKADIIAAIQEG